VTGLLRRLDRPIYRLCDLLTPWAALVERSQVARAAPAQQAATVRLLQEAA